MSGPKRSNWQIREAQRVLLRQQRLEKRNAQISDIESELTILRRELNNLVSTYGSEVRFIEERVSQWMYDVNEDCNYDIRNAWNGLRGIRSYLENQKSKLKERKKIEDMKAAAEREKREQEQLKKQKVVRIMDYFTSLKNEYPDLINEGVEQRIELFTNALTTNPDNEQTLSKIKDFKAKFQQLIEKKEEAETHNEYLKSVLSRALGSDPKPDGADGSIVTGIIDGVPISVHITKKNNEIKFDTPTDGSCKKGIAAFIDRVASENVTLGPIRIQKTGELLNKDTTQSKSTTKTYA